MYPTWLPEELCAMLGQRARDPLSLLYPSPSGDCLWQSRLVPTPSITTEEAGALGGSCQLHRLLALQPQGLENNQQTYWQVWTLLPRVPRLGKLPRNWWKTGHTRLVTTSPPGSSTNSCPTYGRFPHLRVTLSPNLSGRKSLLLPSDAWSQENLRDWTPFSQSLYYTTDRLSNLGSATSSIPACANSKFQDLEKSTSSCDP